MAYTADEDCLIYDVETASFTNTVASFFLYMLFSFHIIFSVSYFILYLYFLYSEGLTLLNNALIVCVTMKNCGKNYQQFNTLFHLGAAALS